MTKKLKIVDNSGGLVNILNPRIYYEFRNSGKTVDEIIYEITKRKKSKRTFEKLQIEKALQIFDLRSQVIKDWEVFKVVFLARCVAGENYVLVQVTYTKESNTFVIDGVKYNDEILPDVFIAYAFD